MPWPGFEPTTVSRKSDILATTPLVHLYSQPNLLQRPNLNVLRTKNTQKLFVHETCGNRVNDFNIKDVAMLDICSKVLRSTTDAKITRFCCNVTVTINTESCYNCRIKWTRVDARRSKWIVSHPTQHKTDHSEMGTCIKNPEILTVGIKHNQTIKQWGTIPYHTIPYHAIYYIRNYTANTIKCNTNRGKQVFGI